MKLSGLFNWKSGPDGAEAPREGAPAAGPPADDLDVERRWLQLTRVDSEQFRYFFDKYHDRIHRYLAICVGSEEAAQDLTQETFLYALEHLNRFTWQGASFGVWLFHIARRRALPRYWRAPRAASEAEFVARYRGDEVEPDPGADLDRARMLARMRLLVQELPPARRDAIVLHVQLEYTLDQTAAIMGISPLTVRSHVQRGQRQLAAALHADPALGPAEQRLLGALAAEERGLSPRPGGRAGAADDGAGHDDDGDGSRRNRSDDDA